MADRVLGKVALLQQQREILGHQVNPVGDDGVGNSAADESAAQQRRRDLFGLVLRVALRGQASHEAESGHERVEAGPVAAARLRVAVLC